MKTEIKTPTFVAVPDAQGMAIINLRQIAMIRDFRTDCATFEMSNGKSVTIHGAEAIAKILGILAHDAITLQGQPFTEFIEEMCAAESPAS